MTLDQLPEQKTGSVTVLPPLMRSTVRVEVTDGPDKLVWLPLADEPVAMGMHGELAEHYKAQPGAFEPRASTLDYVIGAVAACLTGTLKRALVARGLRVTADTLQSVATGEIVLDGDVPVVRSITVHYTLSGVSDADREKAERAHAVHHRACAVSRSVEAAIEINTELELS